MFFNSTKCIFAFSFGLLVHLLVLGSALFLARTDGFELEGIEDVHVNSRPSEQLLGGGDVTT